MLRLWPVHGKLVLLTGAGSNCSAYLGHWARARGATRVSGVYRSALRLQGLEEAGVEPVALHDEEGIKRAAIRADITFDALGGVPASCIIAHMRAGTTFVGYGLLTGRPIQFDCPIVASYHRFHMREHLEIVAPHGLNEAFNEIWPLLADMALPEAHLFPPSNWREAVAAAGIAGASKPVLHFSHDEI